MLDMASQAGANRSFQSGIPKNTELVSFSLYLKCVAQLIFIDF